MKSVVSFVGGALAAAFLLSYVNGSASAEKDTAIGRYQISSAEKLGVYRVDTATGAVSLCISQGNSGQVQTRCFAPSSTFTAPPDDHVDYLKANPDSAESFDQRYGPGASKRYLPDVAK